MGEAKRRRDVGDRVSWCRNCTLCCVLPDIESLEKPMYVTCRHVEGGGCAIFGQPRRPSACTAYQCAYLSARLAGSPDRNRIPHPMDAGAYFHRDPKERLYVVFVDPRRPEQWKRTAIAPYLMQRLKEGFELLIVDRGRRMAVSSPAIFLEVLKRDYVAFAASQGRPLDIDSFAGYRPDH